jgi:hypothetical protein
MALSRTVLGLAFLAVFTCLVWTPSRRLRTIHALWRTGDVDPSVMGFLGKDEFPDVPQVLIHLVSAAWHVVPAELRGPYATLAALVRDVDVPHFSESSPSEGIPFGIAPYFHGRLVPGANATQWETRCWSRVEAHTIELDDRFELKVSVSGHKKLFCDDFYFLLTASDYGLGHFPTPVPGTKTFKYSKKHLTESEVWDVRTLGVRAFRTRAGPVTAARDLLESALLFLEPMRKRYVSAGAAARNAAFMRDYAGVKSVRPRKDTGTLMLNESEIGSGDFFGIYRLDGVDPMLAWGMGSHTGHTTVALWENGTLYVCESTGKTSYWSVNGVQRTPYREWIAKAQAAGFSVVHIPLSAESRKIFNEAAANAWFHSVDGLDYGWSNMLWGWVDTLKDNYPCLPQYAAGEYCLSWEAIETLFPQGGKLSPAIAQLYNESWNLRVTGSAVSNLSPTELYRAALGKNMSLESIPALVEVDDTVYSQMMRNGTTTRAPAMVCNVFVCRMWKAAGLLKGVDFNCAEQTNRDIYSLDVVAPPSTRPPQCVAADPNNTLCQLMGAYTLELPDAGTKKAYAHMHEKCPSMAPEYKAPDGC